MVINRKSHDNVTRTQDKERVCAQNASFHANSVALANSGICLK